MKTYWRIVWEKLVVGLWESAVVIKSQAHGDSSCEAHRDSSCVETMAPNSWCIHFFWAFSHLHVIRLLPCKVNGKIAYVTGISGNQLCGFRWCRRETWVESPMNSVRSRRCNVKEWRTCTTLKIKKSDGVRHLFLTCLVDRNYHYPAA